MENVKTWQYLVIGGPAFALGCFVCWAFMIDYVRAIEDALLADCDCRRQPDVKEISRRIMSQ